MSRVAVIGAGRQGVAAAYDLAKYRDDVRVLLADYDMELAQAGCERITSLLGTDNVSAASLDVSDREGLDEFLSRFDLAIAAAPYKLNPYISHAGIGVGCHVVDMGLDTPDALEVHARDAEAVAKGVAIVTDCGVAPGLVNIAAYKLLREHPDTVNLRLYCGGLPESAAPPFFHKVGFSVDSLLGEYVDEVDSLKGGKVVRTEALEDFESLEFGDLGTVEAVTTSGGTGTAPYHLEGKLNDYEYKTLRFAGHWNAMFFMRDAGLWAEEPLAGGCVPRDLSLQIMERHMVEPNYRDIVVARVVAETPTGKFGYDLIDRHDTESGFTAMQRTTGFSTAIVAHAVLDGAIKPGCAACEVAIHPDTFFVEAAKRGIHLTPYVLKD